MKANTFTDSCLCKQHQLKYKLPKGMHRNAIDVTYCFRCLDRSNEETILVRLDWPGRSGLWGIKFNNAYFIDTDRKFPREHSHNYYTELLSKEITLLDPQTSKPVTFVIEGIKLSEEMEEAAAMNQEKKTLLVTEQPVKLPKKIRHSSRESYIPQSGFKGHH